MKAQVVENETGELDERRCNLGRERRKQMDSWATAHDRRVMGSQGENRREAAEKG